MTENMAEQSQEQPTTMPVEVRTALLLLGGCGLVFAGLGVILLGQYGDVRSLFPAIFAVLLELAVIGGLLAKLRATRIVGIVLISLVVVLQLVIVLGQGPWWLRLIMALMSAALVYVIVLLNTGPTRRYLGGAR